MVAVDSCKRANEIALSSMDNNFDNFRSNMDAAFHSVSCFTSVAEIASTVHMLCIADSPK
jgi:hypothetical protein